MKKKWNSIQDFADVITEMDEYNILNTSQACLVAQWIVIRLKGTSNVPEVFYGLFKFVYYDPRFELEFCKHGIIVNSIQRLFWYYWWPWSSIRKKINPLIKNNK